MKIYVLTTDTNARGREVRSFRKPDEAFGALVGFIQAEAIARGLSLSDIPAMTESDWIDGWDYVFGDLMDYALIEEVDFFPPLARIAITVNGGVAELADAENWPEELQLFIVDYDVEDDDDLEALSDLDGKCQVSKWEPSDQMTGHFASKVAEAWQYD